MIILSHNDKPSSVDGLQQQSFIDNIAAIIKNCEAPKGIGINGYWGTGKTSTLLQLYKTLTGVNLKEKIPKNSPVIPVWFEAWRYQHEAIPIVALLNEIRAAFNLWNKILEESAKITSVTFLGILGAFDETIKAASGGIMSPKLGDIPKIGSDYEKERYRNALASQEISNLLENAIDTALKNSGRNEDRKLVIFIDDLDRCHPEAALKLLEGIKVYLNLKNCVIVFAIDQRQIERALKKALDIKEDSDNNHQAREYLEKICQDIYHLPLPDKTHKSTYLGSLLTDLDLGAQKPDHLREIQKVTSHYDCLPANPRKIKALANRLAVMLRKPVDLTVNNRDIPATVTIKFNYALLLAMAIIYTFHRELNEQLERNPEYIKTVVMYAKDFSRVDSKLIEPMKGIKPAFAGADELPTNPSDGNVFRLHKVFEDLDIVNGVDIKPFLGI